MAQQEEGNEPDQALEHDKTSSSDDNQMAEKKTLGEELFLVHLNRFDLEERSPDDFDYGERRSKPDHSVGEELWEVHRKRMEGLVDEEDDGEKLKPNIKGSTSLSPKKKQDTIKHPRRIMMLRNRNVRVRIG